MPLRRFLRQDHIGQAEKQEKGPDGSRQEFATDQPSRIGPAEGPEGLSAAVDADEAEEEDADVHGEVEEHGGNSAHKHTQPCGGHVGVGQHLQKKHNTCLTEQEIPTALNK